MVAHFTLDIQETESMDLVERDLEGEIGLVDQSNDLINLGHNPKSLELSNDIGREFGMRVIYKDSRLVECLLISSLVYRLNNTFIFL